MFIKIGDKEYELSTKLGTGKKIEDRFKLPIMQVFGRLEEALTDELVTIVSIAAGKTDDPEFRNAIYENWDYSDMYITVQELIIRLMYSGTPEQIEAKLEKTPQSEERKNMIRELLGVPLKAAPSTGKS